MIADALISMHGDENGCGSPVSGEESHETITQLIDSI